MKETFGVFQASRPITSSLPSIIVNCQADEEIDKDGGNAQQPKSTPQYFTSEAGRGAEILLSIKSFTSHISAGSMEESPELMKIMFPDSQIATQVHLHRTKLGYMMNHGLVLIIKGKLRVCSKKLTDSLLVSMSFSMPSQISSSLMYILYLSMRQLNVCEAITLDQPFLVMVLLILVLPEVHHGLDYVNKSVQVGMNGPNVKDVAQDVERETF